MSSNKSDWKHIEDQIYDTFPIFKLIRSRRKNPITDKEIDFVRVEGLDWVNVLAFTENNEVVLVRQYRHGREEYTLELPGGCIEQGESPANSGKRELLEETGYSANELQELGMIYPNPAMYAINNYFFVARGVQKVAGQALDDGEDIKVVTIPFKELLEMIKDGRFKHGMSISAIGLYVMQSRP